jgi:hypothetical protein
MSFRRVVQKYYRFIRSKVLARPGYPVAGVSWWLWSTHNHRACSVGMYHHCWYNRWPLHSWHSDRDISWQCCFPSYSMVRIIWAKASVRIALEISCSRGNWPWLGAAFADRYRLLDRFCGFRTAFCCSMRRSSPPPEVGLLTYELGHQVFHQLFPDGRQF